MHLNAEFQRKTRRDKKVFLSDQCKEIEENNKMRKTRNLFKKIRDTKGTFHAEMVWTWEKQKILRRDGKNTKKNYTKKIFKTHITTMVLSPRARHPGMRSEVGLRKHHYKQSQWRWWNSSWVISNPKRWSCEISTLNMTANLENSEVATGLENVSFHSNPKERQCQRMLRLPQNCIHLTH